MKNSHALESFFVTFIIMVIFVDILMYTHGYVKFSTQTYGMELFERDGDRMVNLGDIPKDKVTMVWLSARDHEMYFKRIGDSAYKKLPTVSVPNWNSVKEYEFVLDSK